MIKKPYFSLLVFLIFISAYEGDIFIFIVFHSYHLHLGGNITTVKIPDIHPPDISGHKAAPYWLVSTTLGLIGSLVNILVLLMFVQERETLFTGVNTMIWYNIINPNQNIYLITNCNRMENSYRLGYTFSAQLRNYKMFTGSTFLDKLMDHKWVILLCALTLSYHDFRHAFLFLLCLHFSWLDL